MRTVKKALKSRALLIWLLIAIQLSIVFYISIHLTRYYYVYSYVTFVLAFVFVLYLMKASRSMSYKMAWIVVSFTFPVFGIALYLIFGGNRLTKRGRKKMEFMNAAYQDAVKDEDDATDELEAEFPDAARQVKYIRRTTMTPPVKNNETRYFRSGEEMFPVILEELRKAEKYIFLEYFIIGEGKMWDAVHEILLEKVKKGVDVRVIYDDIGCWLSLDRHFDRKLRAEGIDCRIFQRFVPVLNARQNNRDHRKILAVDGVTAFTGGINIADEYINEDSHVGYWKDNGVMMRGESAWSFTVMFLTMWDYLCGKAEDRAIRYEAYKPPRAALEGISGGGYVQPYTDSPLDGEPVGENVSRPDREREEIRLDQHALPDHRREDGAGAHPGRAVRRGRAHCDPGHPGQKAHLRDDAVLLPEPARARRADLRIHPRLRAREELCLRRRLRRGGQREPRLPEPVPAFRMRGLDVQNGLRGGREGGFRRNARQLPGARAEKARFSQNAVPLRARPHRASSVTETNRPAGRSFSDARRVFVLQPIWLSDVR